MTPGRKQIRVISRSGRCLALVDVPEDRVAPSQHASDALGTPVVFVDLSRCYLARDIP
jgi:hypothetical protein